MEYSLSGFTSFQNHISPLTLDLDGDGIELSHMSDQNVYFDIDNDNFAEKVGWVDPDDGQLAMDRNGNVMFDYETNVIRFPLLKVFSSNVKEQCFILCKLCYKIYIIS